MKIARTCFFVLIFSLAVFSQNAVQNSEQKVEYKGRFDLENPNERIETYKFLEEWKKSSSGRRKKFSALGCRK